MDTPLFVLAFDHRNSLMRSFFGVEGEPGPADAEAAREAKRLIGAGLLRAVETGAVPRDAAAALVDATYGADAIAALREARIRIAVPVETSGAPELTFEFDDWRERLERIDPTWAKVLLRYNPTGEPERNARQRARLRELTEHCLGTGRALMIEVLVPPEPAQAGPGYDRDLRPGLMVRAIGELRDDGAAGDVWKIEGLDRAEDCEAVAVAAGAPCIVLGRGADADAVERWIRVGAGVPGFVGFAIGRSIWWDPLKAYFASPGTGADRETAVASLAASYAGFAEAFAAAS